MAMATHSHKILWQTAAMAESERGPVDRIVALTDGVVAIALTLLALDLKPDLPAGGNSTDLLNSLRDQSGLYVSFLIAFFVIASYWVAHHQVMKAVRTYDGNLIRATIYFLFGITLIPVTSYINGDFGSSLGHTLFAINILGVSLALMWITRLARAHSVTEHGQPAPAIRSGRWHQIITVAVPSLVIALAWTTPGKSSYAWLLLLLDNAPSQIEALRHRRRPIRG
jgi:uncharacterized membrane protein